MKCIERPNVDVDDSAKHFETDRSKHGRSDGQPENTCWGTVYSLCSNTIIDSLQVTGAKGDLCPGSFMSTGAHAPVAPVESAPMQQYTTHTRQTGTDRRTIESKTDTDSYRWE